MLYAQIILEDFY